MLESETMLNGTTATQGCDAVELPTAEEDVGDAAGIMEEAPAFAEGQLDHLARYEVVAQVDIGVPIFRANVVRDFADSWRPLPRFGGAGPVSRL